MGLLRAIPRTAPVVAHTAATVYELNREPFLTAVLGHAPTLRQADRIADARLATGAPPGNRDSSGAGTAEAGQPPVRLRAQGPPRRHGRPGRQPRAGPPGPRGLPEVRSASLT